MPTIIVPLFDNDISLDDIRLFFVVFSHLWCDDEDSIGRSIGKYAIPLTKIGKQKKNAMSKLVYGTVIDCISIDIDSVDNDGDGDDDDQVDAKEK
jgi:hypothetical protein